MNTPEDPRFVAAVQMIERTGAQSFRVGFTPDEDGPPVVWYAVAEWSGNRAEAAAAMTPLDAVFRLCEQVIDGGICAHCHRATIFVSDMETDLLDLLGCVYSYDPELRKFRRDCEGDA